MTLTLNNLPADLEEALRRDAERSGRTVEERALELLREGLGVRERQARRYAELSDAAEAFRDSDWLDKLEKMREESRRYETGEDAVKQGAA